jgi:hypothetical protein
MSSLRSALSSLGHLYPETARLFSSEIQLAGIRAMDVFYLAVLAGVFIVTIGLVYGLESLEGEE